MVERDDGIVRTLRTLHEITREMMGAEDETAVFEKTTEAASKLLGFEYSTIRRYERDPDRLVPVAASDQLRDVAGDRDVYARGESVQFRAIDEGELLVYPKLAAIDDAVDRTDGGSMLVVPLGDYGVLTLGTETPRPITPEDTELARILGANIETALNRVHRLTELQTRTAELAERTQRLDTLVSKAAHELRNPLNVLMGRIELARQTGDCTHLEDLEQSVDRMDRLIDDVITLAGDKAVTLEREPVLVASRARECWQRVRTGEATLTVELSEKQKAIADPDRLEQIFGNLFRNAVEHGGSDVTVTVGRLTETASEETGDSGNTEGGLCVTDDGDGIDSDGEKLLEPGVADAPHWTGVGLGVVSRLAELHGWSVQLTDSDAGGVRVEFCGVEWQ